MSDASVRGAKSGPWSRDELPETGLPSSTRIALLLKELGHASQEVERHLGRVLAVNPTDLGAMRHLIDAGSLSPSQLARQLGITTAAATLVVDRLEAVGHAERSRDKDDRRRIVVTPARESVAKAVGELMPMVQRVNSLIENLSPEEQATVEHFLTGVLSAYREVSTST